MQAAIVPVALIVLLGFNMFSREMDRQTPNLVAIGALALSGVLVWRLVK